MKRILSLLFAFVLVLATVGEAFGQRSFGRSGGFGGGRSSFGGGSFGRSSGGFGRSSGGFFGGGGGFSRPSTPSYSRPSSPTFSGPRTGSGSFGRSGGFGNSGRINSSSANPSRNYGGYGGGYGSYGNRTTIVYGGSPYSYYGGGGFWSGYSMGVLTSPWTHWMPWHPGFYVNPPYYQNGAYYDGGFSFTRLILGLVIIGFIIWFVLRLFGGGGNKNIRYTNYR